MHLLVPVALQAVYVPTIFYAVNGLKFFSITPEYYTKNIAVLFPGAVFLNNFNINHLSHLMYSLVLAWILTLI